jgi:hypothetical protein
VLLPTPTGFAEVTQWRRDVATDGRHAVVAPASTITDDLGRRDFTANAMALEWTAAGPVLHDPFDGQRDIAEGVLRVVGDPSQRFAEDGLRVLRAYRFLATMGWHATPDLRDALVYRARDVLSASGPRRWQEWAKMLSARDEVALRHALHHMLGDGVAAIAFGGTVPWDMSRTVEAIVAVRGLSPAAALGAYGALAGWSPADLASLQLPSRLAEEATFVARLARGLGEVLRDGTLGTWRRVCALEAPRAWDLRDCATAWHGVALGPHSTLSRMIVQGEMGGEDPLPRSTHALPVSGQELIALGVAPRMASRWLTVLWHLVLDDPTWHDHDRLLAAVRSATAALDGGAIDALDAAAWEIVVRRHIVRAQPLRASRVAGC